MMSERKQDVPIPKGIIKIDKKAPLFEEEIGDKMVFPDAFYTDLGMLKADNNNGFQYEKSIGGKNLVYVFLAPGDTVIESVDIGLKQTKERVNSNYSATWFGFPGFASPDFYEVWEGVNVYREKHFKLPKGDKLLKVSIHEYKTQISNWEIKFNLEPTPIDSGTLNITTNPENLGVLLDGEPFRYSPCYVSGIAAGKHKISIESREEGNYRKILDTVTEEINIEKNKVATGTYKLNDKKSNGNWNSPIKLSSENGKIGNMGFFYDNDRIIATWSQKAEYTAESISLAWSAKGDYSQWNNASLTGINSLEASSPLFVCKNNNEYCLFFKKDNDLMSASEQQPDNSKGMFVSYSGNLDKWSDPVLKIKKQDKERIDLIKRLNNELYYKLKIEYLKYNEKKIFVSYSKDLNRFTEEYQITELVNKYGLSYPSLKIIKDKKNVYWALWMEVGDEKIEFINNIPTTKLRMVVKISSSKNGSIWDKPLTIIESGPDNSKKPEDYSNLGILCNKDNKLIVYYTPNYYAGLAIYYSEDGKSWKGPKQVADFSILGCVLAQDDLGRYLLLYTYLKSNISDDLFFRYCDDIFKEVKEDE
jgi:hypothetical protein